MSRFIVWRRWRRRRKEEEVKAVHGARKSGGGWGLFGSFISTLSDVNKTLSFQTEAQSTHQRTGQTYMRVFVR